jgi:hypothetical protein
VQLDSSHKELYACFQRVAEQFKRPAARCACMVGSWHSRRRRRRRRHKVTRDQIAVRKTTKSQLCLQPREGRSRWKKGKKKKKKNGKRGEKEKLQLLMFAEEGAKMAAAAERQKENWKAICKNVNST